MIPLFQFGRDHWSTFAYIVTRIVDHAGQASNAHMRCDPKRHPLRVGRHSGGIGVAGFPQTRLHDGTEHADHDDWDCLEDAEAAGLLTVSGTGLHPVYALTPLGDQVANALRLHKRQGGSWETFRWPPLYAAEVTATVAT